MRYTCIHRRRNLYPIQMMCGAMKVSTSGYYAWRTRPESRRRRYDRALTQAIRLLHAESDGTYMAVLDCTQISTTQASLVAGLKWPV